MPEMDEEQTFAQMWIDAQVRFEQRTNKPLKRAKNRSLNDVLAQLDQHFNPEDTKMDDKKARAKEWAINLLKFVQLLGGIIAQGASVVVGPASLCFNALSFLLDIPTRISKFYDDLAALFEELSTLIKQFRVYQRMENYAKIGMELKEHTHKLLIVFVDICAISIDFFGGSKLHNLGTLTKLSLFNNDSGIPSKLAEFKTLIDHQSQISGAITLEHVLKSEHDSSNSFQTVFEELNKAAEDSQRQLEKSQQIHDEVVETHDDVKTVKVGTEALVKDRNERDTEKKQREEYENICKKLSITAESIQQWEKEIEQIQNTSLPETGAWLKAIVAYRQWIDIGSGATSQLILSGDAGSGKSYLAFTLLDIAKAEFTDCEDGPMKVSVAFYRFTKKKQRSSDSAVRDSLKSMAAQIAKNSRVFSKTLSSALKAKDIALLRDTSPIDILRELFASPNRTEDLNTAFVLLFDGLDQLSNDDANQLLKAVLELDTSKVRIILTGTDDKFKSCQNLSGRTTESMPLIRVQEHNEADIRKFIEQDLTDQKILQGDAPEVLKIVEQLRQTLPEKANGNFNDVRQIINGVKEAIDSEASEEKIMQLISVEKVENSEVVCGRLLAELNDSLNDQEIEQLNELLAWVVYSFNLMTTEQLTAALFLRTRRALFQNLKVKINRKYYKILRTELTSYGENIQVSTTDLENYLRKSERRSRVEGEMEGNDDPRISMTININHVRQSQVRRFIWDLSESIFLDKFTFANPATQSGSSVGIGANRVDSELLLLRRCFDVLLEKQTKETSALSSYAIFNFSTHLESLMDVVDEIKPTEKSEILDNLITLFQSPDTFGEHMNETFLDDGVGLHNGLAVQQYWLRDPEAKRRLNRKSLSWLKKANAENLLFPWKEIATMIARKWLDDRLWDVEHPYLWISIFVLRLKEMQDEALDTAETSNGIQARDQDSKKFYSNEDVVREKDTASARIERSAEWSVKAANIEMTSLYYERLGATYFHYDQMSPAKEALLKAKEFPSPSWTICSFLMFIYIQEGEIGLALQETEVISTEFRSRKALDARAKKSFVGNLVVSAECEVKLGHPSEAIAKLKEAIQADEFYYESYYKLFKILNDQERYPDALEILDDMDKTHDAQHEKLTKLSTMLLGYNSWIGGLVNLERMLHTTRSHASFQTVLHALQEALLYAKASDRVSETVALHIGCGMAFASCNTTEIEGCLDSALTHWEECFRLGIKHDDWDSQQSAIAAGKCIFNHHFSQALAAFKSRRMDTTDYIYHVDEMEKLAEEACRPQYDERPLVGSLASFYALIGNQEKARRLLMTELRVGFGLLSDEDPENDYIGYDYIATVLMRAGDDLDALSAWSLYGPPERHTRDELDQALPNSDMHANSDSQDIIEKDLSPVSSSDPPKTSRYCDGRCDKQLTYADSLWFCKICEDIQFCEECLHKLKTGDLPRYVCATDHDWLLVPSWMDEYAATGKGRVRVGGALEGGKRVGGEIVAIDQWLDTIREQWGMKRSNQEEQPQEGGR